jgi:hypothetical protein
MPKVISDLNWTFGRFVPLAPIGMGAREKILYRARGYKYAGPTGLKRVLKQRLVLGFDQLAYIRKLFLATAVAWFTDGK